MTRDTDIDPVSGDNLSRMHADGKPNADDRAYLQTRCDVANNAGARLFISIHINSAPSEGARGTNVLLVQAARRRVRASAARRA